MDLQGPQLVIYPGGMGGQKTAKAVLELQRIRDGTHYGYKAFKPRNSIRDIDQGREELVSRAGPTLEAVIVEKASDILRHVTRQDLYILIDEAHMFGMDLRPVVEELLDRRSIVHAAFLINDYGDRPFGIATYLLSQASRCDGFHFGLCSVDGCTSNGSHSQLLIDGEVAPYTGPELRAGDIKAGAEIHYKLRCHTHYIKTEDKTSGRK